MQQSIEFIFRYRLHIGLLMFLWCLTIFSNNSNLETFIISLSFGFLFVFIYLFNKVTDLKEDQINLGSMPININNSKIVLNISYFFAIIPIPFLFFINLEILAVYIISLILLGILYSYPLKLLGFKKRLKDLPFTKNIISALTWSFIITSLPALYYNKKILINYNIISNFLIVFVIEVIWDIRDIDGDKAMCIKTIPNQFGIGLAKLLCSIIIIYLIFKNINNLSCLIPFILMLLTIIFIKKDSHPYWFQGLVIIWLVKDLINLISLYS